MCKCSDEIKSEVQSLFKAHEKDEDSKFETMQHAIEENSQVIKSHIEDTRELIKFIKSAEGAVTFLNYIVKAAKWVIGLSVLVYAVELLYRHWPFK